MLMCDEIRLNMMVSYLHERLDSVQLKLFREKLDSLLLFGFDPALELKKECMMCGDRDKQHLHFHHIDPTLKKFNIPGLKRSIGWDMSKVVDELRKCVVLCANCHLDAHKKVKYLYTKWVDEVSS